MLNLACTDHPDHGYAKGHYYLIVGTSRSGKTWLSLSCLAEAANNRQFHNHRFIYDDVEHGALMDIRRFFGKGVAKRLRTRSSVRIEDFYDRLHTLNDKGDPYIYILDSMDALSSEAEVRTFVKQSKARRGNKEPTGSYTDGKPKVNSQNLRRAVSALPGVESILIIINQTRDKLTGYGGKTRSGGHALQFYATLEIWSDIEKELMKVYRRKKRRQGVLVTLRVRKNRITGKDRIIQMPIYNTYGMDDVGSCVDYLVGEGHWTQAKNSGTITAEDFDFRGKRAELIKHITDNSMEKDVTMTVADVWKDIEKAVAIKRKPRYV
jgi:RecA/RadA recombinase